MSRSRVPIIGKYTPTAAERRRRKAAESTLFPTNEQAKNEDWVRAYRSGQLSRATLEELQRIEESKSK